ncbi:MAG TPA: hypothetical protein VJR92_13390 [Gemmatimonadaceae bacterium]|nr:hypothetical protein [Gemmatimonadaceae bacterium]
MGLFWDLIQHNQIQAQASRSSTLEQRVTVLESELTQTRKLLQTALERLEKHVGADLNDDGRVGR